jgi:tetratricopeptide (TPR) repeat protein
MLSADEMPVRLSVAIIARDAAEALAETLVSIRNVAGEIVVLDTGSSDETRQIAGAFGARVFERPWDDSFSAARNACLTFVQGMWVLWLDCGETLGKDEARLLAEFLEQHADPATAYSLRIALPPLDELSAGEQVERLRLHPRRPGLQFSSRVRESLDRALFAFGIGTDSLPLTIQRSRRDLDPAVKAARARRNLRLAELQQTERGPSAEMHNCLAEAHHALSAHDQAAIHYRRAFELAQQGSPAQLEAYYGMLTCLETVAGPLPDAQDQDPRRSAQLSLCTTALDTFPLDAQLLCAMGGYLQSLGRIDLAVRAYDVCYRHGRIEPGLWHLPDIREVAASCQAALLELTSDADAALALLQDARQAYPDSLRIARQILELHVQHGRRDEALLVAGQMPDTPARETLRTAIFGACAAVKGSWTAARSYLQSAIDAGCRERFAWRWLATSLVAVEDFAQAEAVIAQWEAIDPASPEPKQIRQSLPAAAAPASAPAEIAKRSVRIDAPQEASGPSIAPAAVPTRTIGGTS